MGILGPKPYISKKGEKWWLHKTEGRGGTVIYFFSKDPIDAIDIPKGWEVVENPKTGLPILRKKKV